MRQISRQAVEGMSASLRSQIRVIAIVNHLRRNQIVKKMIAKNLKTPHRQVNSPIGVN